MNFVIDHETLMRRNFPATGVHVLPAKETVVFLTVNTEKRASWLSNDFAHSALRQVWTEATAWLVGEYILMPDHLHLFCAPRDLTISIEAWMTYWKSQFRKQHHKPDWRWQSRGWHHRLRGHESYAQKWQYVWQNPVRRGLVPLAEQWPYWGRIYELRWQGQ